MGRDHSETCPKCGASYGGFYGPDECACPIVDKATKDVADKFAAIIERAKAGERFANLAACIHEAAVEEMRCRVGAARAYQQVRAALAERNVFIRSEP